MFIKKIKGVNKLSILNARDIKKTLAGSLPIVLDPIEKSYFRKALFAFLCLFLVVFVFKLFSYKDYIGNLIQYDDNWLYFSGNKIRINNDQSQIINLLERNGEFSSVELNKVVSKNKKYAKSHQTILRKNFIKDMNELFFELFGSQQLHIISYKSQKDKRQILYKTSKEIFKKESFLNISLLVLYNICLLSFCDLDDLTYNCLDPKSSKNISFMFLTKFFLSKVK